MKQDFFQQFVQRLATMNRWKSGVRRVAKRRTPSRRLAIVSSERLEDRTLLTTMLAVDNADNLLTFDSATPGTVTSVAITGQGGTENIQGISVRPATGELYGLGIVDDGATRTGQIYTIDPATAVATAVGVPFSTTLADTDFWGFDFNPVADRIRITNRDQQNLRVNPNDGTLAGTDTNLSETGINGVSYTNPAAGTTTLFAADFDSDELATIGGPGGVPSPNGGVVTTVGSTGLSAGGSFELDIDNVGVARGSASGNLYTINLATGAATLVGGIAGAPTLLGLTSQFTTLDIVGTAGNDTLVVTASGPNSGTYSLNGGPAVAFANIPSFSFLAGSGDDTLTIINSSGAVFAPAGGTVYNGQGDSDRLIVDDSAVSGGNTYDIDGDSITRNGTDDIDFSGVESIGLSTGDGDDSVSVTNLSLDAATLTGAGLSLDDNGGDDDVTLDNVDVINAGAAGASITDFEEVTVESGSSFNSNDGSGLAITGATTSVTISETTASGNQVSGIDIDDAGTVEFTNVTVNGNGIDGTQITNIGDVTVIDSTANGNFRDGFHIENAEDVLVDPTEATGNGFTGTSDAGIFIDTAASFTDIDGNYSGNVSNGIELIDIAGDVTLTRTTLNDNDADDSGVGSGLSITANVATFAVGGSLIINGGSFNDRRVLATSSSS